MFARLTEGEVKPDKIDEAIRVWNEVIPPYRQEQGFRNAYLLIDRATGNVRMLSLWSSEEASSAHAESGAMMQALSHFFELLSGPANMEGYEVAGQIE